MGNKKNYLLSWQYLKTSISELRLILLNHILFALYFASGHHVMCDVKKCDICNNQFFQFIIKNVFQYVLQFVNDVILLLIMIQFHKK